MLNKRGQGLSMNTIVVIILALLVLIIVAIIFTGGTATLQEWLKNVFGTTTKGTDRELAVSQCNNLCQFSSTGSESSYCTTTFDIKRNDGSVDKGVSCVSLTSCDRITC